jgi:hypothetical protein
VAIESMIRLERTRQLLGLGESPTFAQDFQNVMTIAGKACVKEEYQMCVDQHIIHRMIPVWLGFKRQYELLGGADSGPEPEELKLAEDLTKKRLTFELQFDSNGIFDAGGGDGYSAAVTSKIRLQFDPATMTITGEGPLESKFFEMIPGD